MVLALALLLAVREALALSNQEGGFGELVDNFKGRDPSWGIKPSIRSGNHCTIGITPLPPLPLWLVLEIALLLAVREAFALYEQEGAFKELLEGSDRRAPSRGNKHRRRFIPKIFDPANYDAVMDTYTADAAADVAETGWILCLEAVPFTLDVMVQTYADVSFRWQEWKVVFLLFPKMMLSTNESISMCGFERFQY